MTSPVRVLIVDDQALLRAGFRALLDSDAGTEVVGEAADGEKAVRLALQTKPDVVLMDIQMALKDGLQATAEITGNSVLSHTRVIVLTTFELDEYVFGALESGASGFLLKDIEPQALIDAVRLVHEGQALLAPQVTRRLIEAYVLNGGTQSGGASPRRRDSSHHDSAGNVAGAIDQQLQTLTPREREVLALVGGGLSNHEIAEHLVLSPLTAKTHVSRILAKLGARDRAKLVVIAYETQIVGLDA